MFAISRTMVAFGAAVVFSLGAAASASATTINGSGSSLQKNAQQSLWAPSFTTAFPSDAISYTSTSSGSGLSEFGNDNSVLKTAGGVDVFVGTDDAPDATQTAKAKTATGTNANEITVPVAQAPVAIIASLPAGLTISNTQVALSQAQLEQIYHHAVPASGAYAANTWGAALNAAGASITGDTGGASATAITLQVRVGDSGTTRAVKGFLEQIDTGDTHGWNHEGSDSWTNTSGTTTNGGANTGGGALVTSTLSNPGSIGYANLADTTATVTNLPVAVTTGGSASHQVIRFQLKVGAIPRDASSNPASQTTAAGNLTTSGSGSWSAVPASITATTTWENTIASSTSTSLAGYPLAAPTYDLGWDNYAAVTNGAGGAATYTAAQITTANNYFDYLVSTAVGKGQPTVTANGYAPLPTNVQTKAVTAAGLVN
ncbi:hypothetical protein AB0L40_00100 [Patulibacter sp. NPDC049589]|uniref:hypothetical protein n=1 Tax=Patulibacter sp. NPDC049589 TaxID=3154731 RepID=UPI00342D5127